MVLDDQFKLRRFFVITIYQNDFLLKPALYFAKKN